MNNRRRDIQILGTTVGAMTFGDHSDAAGNASSAASGPIHANANGDLSRVLLVVAADVERDAVLRVIGAHTHRRFTRAYAPHHTLYGLGRIAGTEVVLAQVGQGTVTPDAAGTGASALIEATRPDYIVLVGMCYGLKDDGSPPQRLGDVVVSSQLLLIAHRKVLDTSDISRGGAVHPSTQLLDRFRTAGVDWGVDAKLHVGPVVSESVLVNSEKYRRRLKKLFPEAIAGEMEGAAFYAAAALTKTEWCLVKGICDWGYNKTDEYHGSAAGNAAAFVLHTICIGGFDQVNQIS